MFEIGKIKDKVNPSGSSGGKGTGGIGWIFKWGIILVILLIPLVNINPFVFSSSENFLDKASAML